MPLSTTTLLLYHAYLVFVNCYFSCLIRVRFGELADSNIYSTPPMCQLQHITLDQFLQASWKWLYPGTVFLQPKTALHSNLAATLQPTTQSVLLRFFWAESTQDAELERRVRRKSFYTICFVILA